MPSFSDVNLYLTGFMGTGKTTVGRAVAQRLGFACLDADFEIERGQRRTIPQIFAESGEAEFRRLEREFMESGHPPRGVVVSCGGGFVVQPGALELLRRKGVILVLHASLETILRRTQGNKNRPLLNVEDPAARLAQLYAARAPIYERAGTRILTDSRPLGDIVSHVLRTYHREAREFVAAARSPAAAPPPV